MISGGIKSASVPGKPRFCAAESVTDLPTPLGIAKAHGIGGTDRRKDWLLYFAANSKSHEPQLI